MTLYLHKDITLEDIQDFKNNKEMIGVKYYPKGVTTNSNSGVDSLHSVLHIIKEIFNHLLHQNHKLQNP